VSGRAVVAWMVVPLVACSTTSHLEVVSPVGSACVERCRRESRPSGGVVGPPWTDCAEECAGVIDQPGPCPTPVTEQCIEIDRVSLGRSLLLVGGVIAGAFVVLTAAAYATYGD
jgi:hypothetical protein